MMICIGLKMIFFHCLVISFQRLNCATNNFTAFFFFRVHGICVCETAEYFYSESDKYLQELGVLGSSCTSRDIMTLYEYIGAGYCISTDEELGNT